MTVSLIVAKALNNAIGKDNRLLWHIPEDLRRFKSLTTGHPIVMGRKTFLSIGRPLPGRRNIVISHDFYHEGTETAGSLEEAIGMCGKDDEIFITGGGQVYREAIMSADRLYVTEVDMTPDADTFFPGIDSSLWKETFREEHDGYRFIDYERI